MKGEKAHSTYESKHISITPKSALTILPPKKIIKALYDYQPTQEHELPFNTGDFFHVIGRENDTEWYEACNPATNVRGLVPVSFFEVLEKKERNSAGSARSIGGDNDSGYSDRGMADSHTSMSGRPGGKQPSLYGVVQYDFKAERPDELDAKAGDSILVIAQSTKEWFVAKPIGRLGGPGLIPVDFIELRDMLTQQPYDNKEEAILRAGVPKVEEWKKMTAEYKNSSIPLRKSPQEEYEQQMARMSLNGYTQTSLLQTQQFDPRMSHMTQQSQIAPDSLLAAVYATVDKWTYENDRYWYIVNAVMETGQTRSLCRNYEDFYDLQIALLQEFPDEAGQNPAQQSRTLPFMPGPVAFVNASISSSRRASLDQYLKKLLELPPYISRHPIVKRLFVLRPGDIERPAQPNQSYEDYGNERQSQISQHSFDSQGDPVPSNGYGRDSQHRSMSQNGHIRSASDLQPPQIGRHDSSISQTTQSSNTQFIKIKVNYQGETIAIRLPHDVNFAQLEEALQSRLGPDFGNLQYKDEPSNSYVNLESDSDLNTALSRNSKLVLFAT
ncbi:hypothetical protein BJ508DRAFT_338367 [Ascobolus immersus RN42]|uniref:Uncharacterized protein n=1 Tax=Ascobolus immersus RN42 TaxID=1160509 RepID=A0A3N4I235_ASCIM|nr:hypothetical protein BJ508DRAFT_338367 [Ascobolus immersus RN42]